MKSASLDQTLKGQTLHLVSIKRNTKSLPGGGMGGIIPIGGIIIPGGGSIPGGGIIPGIFGIFVTFFADFSAALTKTTK